MNRQQVRSRFSALASREDSEIPLDEAALLIAAETDDSFDVEGYLHKLDELARRFESSFDSTTSLGISVSSLSDFIHSEEGFAGNVKNYYEPQNSYLNRVIDTRQGIPITLALVHIGIGKRLNLPVGGISFPGHFLVRYGNDKQLIVDPFYGRLLSEADCANLLRQIAGARARIKPEYFNLAPNKDVLIRMLDNLKQIFWRQSAWENSKACIERQLLLRPEQNEFTIQLGAVYEMQGDLPQARHTYTHVLQGCQDDRIKQLASKRLLALETRAPIVH
ncbi:MAG: transglutaminase-like domain-containing protein [Pseudohongiellaceae bacterium]